MAFSKREKAEIVIDAVAVLLGDYNIYRKKAAILLLKAFLPSNVVRAILEDGNVFPVDRNDPKVLRWKKTVLSKGACEECGSTKNLEAHHIIKWAEYPKGRCDVKNGACLCHRCHTLEHYGDPSYYMMASKKGLNLFE